VTSDEEADEVAEAATVAALTGAAGVLVAFFC